MRFRIGGLLLSLLLPWLLHAQTAPSILLSQTHLQYTAAAGSGAIPSQSVAIINVGVGTANWTAAASTLSGGSWLAVSAGSGSSVGGSNTPPLVDVQVNATELAPGVYFGNVRVDAAGVANSPLFVTVDLTVLPAGSNPGVLVRPTGLVFVQSTSGAAPATQTVRLTSTASSNLDVVTNASTLSGGPWLTSGRNATLTPGSPQTINVQPSATGTLAPGQYFGVVSLLFADQTSATVNVLLLVVTPPAPSCTPQKLLLSDNLGGNFGVPVNAGVSFQAQVKDDCGNTVTDATVSVAFSNGNPPVSLIRQPSGAYLGAWNPSGSVGSNVTVTLTATRLGLANAQLQHQGTLLGPTNTQIAPGGVVGGASFAKTGLAPGEIISVFGAGLNASCPVTAARSLPLPTTLGCVSLLADGQPIPLFFVSQTQINAELPYELIPGSTVNIVARVSSPTGGPDTVTFPVSINIADADPSIFTVNSAGTGAGAILHANYSLVNSANPATTGEIIVIFCVGLGRTNPEVRTGQLVPGATAAVNPVQVSFGGVQAQASDILYAGLAPGFTGLYQINVRVPSGAPTGPAVPIVITQKGVSSSSAVTIALR